MTLTKERLEQFINKPLEHGLTRGEQMEMARIALASLEAEIAPVVSVGGELGFIDHLGRIIEERDNDIEIGQLGCSNYEALMLAAMDAYRAAMLQGAVGNSPAIPDGYALVPVDMAPQMMRAVQLNSELGAYAAANLSGAYSLFREFWDVAVAAAPQQKPRTNNVIDTYQGANGRQCDIVTISTVMKEAK